MAKTMTKPAPESIPEPAPEPDPEPVPVPQPAARKTIPEVVNALETMVARRLYEVWRAVGQLSDPKWDWQNQSTTAQHAWRCVARASMSPAQQVQFGPTEIAHLTHG
jgi:hypothetical protein